MRVKIDRSCGIVIELKFDPEAGVDVSPPIIMWYITEAIEIWKGGQGKGVLENLISIQTVETEDRTQCNLLQEPQLNILS